MDPFQETFAISQLSKNEEKISVWKDTCQGISLGSEIGEWISKCLTGNRQAGLQIIWHQSPETTRPEKTEGLKFYPALRKNDRPLFADEFSYLLLLEASLKDLNERLEKREVGMSVDERRFRPNLLISGNNDIKPYDEDSWAFVSIGKNTVLRTASLCKRCVFTTVDPDKGVKDSQGEPLNTLKAYRTPLDPEEKKAFQMAPLFATNLGVQQSGEICVGDPIYAGN